MNSILTPREMVERALGIQDAGDRLAFRFARCLSVGKGGRALLLGAWLGLLLGCGAVPKQEGIERSTYSGLTQETPSLASTAKTNDGKAGSDRGLDPWTGHDNVAPSADLPMGFTSARSSAGETGRFDTRGADKDSIASCKGIEYRRASEWGTAFEADVKISCAFGWVLEFDFSYNISSIWNASVESHVGKHYVIRGPNWESTAFGFIGTGGDGSIAPLNVRINGNTPQPLPQPEPSPPPESPQGCGYKNRGTPLKVTATVDLCLPPVVCTAETCPPPLGDCIQGRCVYRGKYQGLKTHPEAWATHYCDLSGGGCHGVTQLEYPEVTAGKISKWIGYPLCDRGTPTFDKCIGIVASSPMLVGNSQEAIDSATGKLVTEWGLGMTQASGLCYEIIGRGGTAIVAVTDRCGGYCRCNGSGYQECGPCVNAPTMTPHCACVGAVPGLFDECCGRGCSTTLADCDWCASNNHPHFDVDLGTFRHVCGSDAIDGSCRLSLVRYVKCIDPYPDWPPTGNGSCKINSFFCHGNPTPHQVLVPNTSCCCNWDHCPQPDGSCAPMTYPCPGM